MSSKNALALNLLALFLVLANPQYATSPVAFYSPLAAAAGKSRAANFTEVTTKSQPQGVLWTSRKYVDSPYGNQVVNILDIDPAVVELRAVKTQYSDKYESVLSMGDRTNAIAGVNGGFFCYIEDDICISPALCEQPEKMPRCPRGVQGRSLLIVDGRLESPNCASRTSFGLTESGKPIIQTVGADQRWPGVRFAVGAGPNLVTDGAKNITAEGFCWYAEAHPRTVVAIATNEHILFITVDGRHAGADGMTIDGLAAFLVSEFHVRSAMNLDGGGSTTTYFQRRIVNKPSDPFCDRGCRCVYDGLFAYPKS